MKFLLSILLFVSHSAMASGPSTDIATINVVAIGEGKTKGKACSKAKEIALSEGSTQKALDDKYADEYTYENWCDEPKDIPVLSSSCECDSKKVNGSLACLYEAEIECYTSAWYE